MPADAELSEFLLRACHDLRGPLRNVRLHAELLAKNGASDPELDFVVIGAAAANAVVDGLSDYALALAIEPSRFQPVLLDIMFRSAMAKLAAPIRESGAEVTHGELPTVRGDADRLLQLFEYLLDDALRRRGTNIRISAEAQDGALLFTVSDNGAPLTETVERTFKPFARLHGNQRPGPGLAVCRAIVERHRGTMWAESGALRFTLSEG
jgi:light-regulated signal transduction histidine kinase (bacteriophytochrome)